jgi:hypothetical protein
LHFGGCAINLVGKNEIAENRPVLGAERAILRTVDHCADNIRRQHVRRELQTLEIERDAIRENLERQGLR